MSSSEKTELVVLGNISTVQTSRTHRCMFDLQIVQLQ